MLTAYGIYARRKGWIDSENNPAHYMLKLSERKKRVWWLETEWNFVVTKKFNVTLDCQNIDGSLYAPDNIKWLSDAFSHTQSLIQSNICINSIARWDAISPIFKGLVANQSIEALEILIMRISPWDVLKAFTDLGHLLYRGQSLKQLKIVVRFDFQSSTQLIQALKCFFNEGQTQTNYQLTVQFRSDSNKVLFAKLERHGTVLISENGSQFESLVPETNAILGLKEAFKECMPIDSSRLALSL